MGSRYNRKKHNYKVRNLKRFALSCATTLLVLILLVSGIYSLINKNFNSGKNVAEKTNTVKKIENKEKAKKDSDSSALDKNKSTNAGEGKITEVLITSAGDCTLGSDTKFGYANSLPCVLDQNNKDFSYFFKNVKDIFSKDDLTLVNLETTFTNATTKATKTFNFKADPSYAKALTLGSIEAVNISNNHIHDYLDKGFEDTKKALEDEKVPYFGEGNKVIKTVKGHNFGLLGYQGWNFSEDLKDKVEKDIKELKDKNCTVIINFHWGLEGNYLPYDVQKSLGHFAIDKGADLVIGHHPHVVQSIEKYNDKIICYSMGNFCFGGNFNPKDKDTFVFQTKFKFDNNKLLGYDTKVIPFSISSKKNINDYCPTIAEGSEKIRILNKLKDLSPSYKDNVKDEFLPVKAN
ncbi:CapA family protein [Haloimpatiens sp. FM7315]|uniref:CapA family protein n=1 Tax=Haloimpatiens sp. FM7315 TaxID=3298609 RepID=UPI0035A3602F